ncbi:MAG: S8 family serine peptidase, partial [bacterium]
MRRIVPSAVAALACGLFVIPAPGAAAETGSADTNSPSPTAAEPAYVPGEIIVAYEDNVPAKARTRLRSSLSAAAPDEVSPLADNIEVVHIPAAADEAKVAAQLEQDPRVRYAEPNWVLQSAAVPDDPYVTNGSLWGMYGDLSTPANTFGSQAAEAWTAGHTGSDAVYVGVIDEGIQFDHPDLDGNVWSNPFDPVNGVDDDGNGYVDDTHGWDFVSDDASVYDGSGDDHGTHVAGTIGATGGNGIGVAGVNWDVTMISGKFLGASGGSTTGAIRAIDYMTDLKTRHGLNIVATSNSWGGGGYSQALVEAINRGGDAGILFVAAAGNSALNMDSTNSYPAGYSCSTTAANTPRGWDCIVSVAAIDSAGKLASFSNYGATTVDLGAPGVGIASTLPGGAYGSYSGTSMATPHVSGAVALCAATSPALTPQQLRTALVGSVLATETMQAKTATGGRLDVSSLMASCLPPSSAVSGAPSGLAALAQGDTKVALSWDDSTAEESYHEVQMASGTCGSEGEFRRASLLGAGANSALITGLDADTAYCFRVRAGNEFQGGSVTEWSATAGARTLVTQCAATAFAWRDAVTDGTRLPLTGDDVSTNITLPFPVQPFSTPSTTMTVASNGLLSLTTQTLWQYNNAPIPTTATPNNLVAPYWDDLEVPAEGGVWTHTLGDTPNREFVITWKDVKYYRQWQAGGLTFQVVFSEAD